MWFLALGTGIVISSVLLVIAVVKHNLAYVSIAGLLLASLVCGYIGYRAVTATVYGAPATVKPVKVHRPVKPKLIDM